MKVVVHQVMLCIKVPAHLLAVPGSSPADTNNIFCAVIIENMLPLELHFKKQTGGGGGEPGYCWSFRKLTQEHIVSFISKIPPWLDVRYPGPSLSTQWSCKRVTPFYVGKMGTARIHLLASHLALFKMMSWLRSTWVEFCYRSSEYWLFYFYR